MKPKRANKRQNMLSSGLFSVHANQPTMSFACFKGMLGKSLRHLPWIFLNNPRLCLMAFLIFLRLEAFPIFHGEAYTRFNSLRLGIASEKECTRKVRWIDVCDLEKISCRQLSLRRFNLLSCLMGSGWCCVNLLSESTPVKSSSRGIGLKEKCFHKKSFNLRRNRSIASARRRICLHSIIHSFLCSPLGLVRSSTSTFIISFSSSIFFAEKNYLLVLSFIVRSRSINSLFVCGVSHFGRFSFLLSNIAQNEIIRDLNICLSGYDETLASRKSDTLVSVLCTH